MRVDEFTFHTLSSKRRGMHIPRETERFFKAPIVVAAPTGPTDFSSPPSHSMPDNRPDWTAIHDIPVTCGSCEGVFSPWYRVLIWNSSTSVLPEKSVVGQHGHIEKASVLAHLVGAVLYALVYAPVRQAATPAGRSSSTPALLGLAAVFGNALCLFLSSLYHVYSSTEWAAFVRPLDYLGIYASAALTTVGEVALISAPSGGVAWQSYADPPLAAAALWVFFALRRVIVGRSGSHVYYSMDSGCAFGFARRVYVDGAHACLRACGSILLVFAWIYVLAAPSPHFSTSDRAFVLGSRILGTVLLIVGMAVDNVFVFPDLFQSYAAASRCSFRDRIFPCCGNPSAGCGGCVLNAHFWWHAISLLGMIVATVGTETLLMSLP